jgi:hypothetical protein
VVILAGSDRRPSELPETGRDKHPLLGYKGVDVRIGGRPIVAVVADRLRASGGVGPIYVAGPLAHFRDRVPGATLIEADGTFGDNIRRAIEQVGAEHAGSPVAFTVCDILPDADALGRIFAEYERQAPCDLFFPFVRAPRDPAALGAAAWKPSYLVVERPGDPPTRVLPGHLAVADPGALRLDFVYRLIEIGYRTRNRPIGQRRSAMTRGVVGALLARDLRLLLDFEAPTLTWTVLTAGLSAARKLRAGTVTREELEDALRRVFVSRRHRLRFPERRVRLPIVDELSLALDIDTEEEALQFGGELGAGRVEGEGGRRV